jgi:predicted ArsR family transcriptional regulator
LATAAETSDHGLLDLLRQGSRSIAELCAATRVTPTAVRQRLGRLMAQGLVARQQERTPDRPQRSGRPTYRYLLTRRARRQVGDNFADLALILWSELRAVRDPQVRRGLLQRVANSMAGHYENLITGATTGERMQSLAAVFAERRVPMRVANADETTADATQADATEGGAGRTMSGNGTHAAGRRDGAEPLPILQVSDCPYPDLAEADRGICAVEKMLFSRLLSTDVQLTQCRLDGATCCQFEAS